MKIIINGQVVEERLNKAQRLIRLGKAKVYIEPIKEIPFSNFVPNKKEQKIIDDYSEKAGWPIKELTEEIEIDEPIIFREPEILETESEFEKLPEVTEENKDEPKTYKPKKKKDIKKNENKAT